MDKGKTENISADESRLNRQAFRNSIANYSGPEIYTKFLINTKY